MIKLNTYLLKATGSWEQACTQLLNKAASMDRVVKLVLFGEATDNTCYIEQKQYFKSELERCFTDHLPVISYVAQKPFDSTLTLEVYCIDESAQIDYFDQYIIVSNPDCRMLLIGGICSSSLDLDFLTQSQQIFNQIDTIFSKTGFTASQIIRQWNYIEDITATNANGHQHYQDFNDARSEFYNSCQWENGYPAATGIGTQKGGVLVDLIAIQNNKLNVPIDNLLQVAAHRYSADVLIEGQQPIKTTPKFERARLVGNNNAYLLISGTAAIRGEQSCPADDMTNQIRITMENIDHLYQQADLHISTNTQPKYDILRVYIKRQEEYDDARKYMDANFGDANTAYLWADICREELLVEIEGLTAMK